MFSFTIYYLLLPDYTLTFSVHFMIPTYKMFPFHPLFDELNCTALHCIKLTALHCTTLLKDLLD